LKDTLNVPDKPVDLALEIVLTLETAALVPYKCAALYEFVKLGKCFPAARVIFHCKVPRLEDRIFLETTQPAKFELLRVWSAS
jgi:hypothetical protein